MYLPRKTHQVDHNAGIDVSVGGRRCGIIEIQFVFGFHFNSRFYALFHVTFGFMFRFIFDYLEASPRPG